jgi:hypothetical protein
MVPSYGRIASKASFVPGRHVPVINGVVTNILKDCCADDIDLNQA